MAEAYLRYNENAMDTYTPPVLEDGRLHAHRSTLLDLNEDRHACFCCVYCWGSICLKPVEDARTCLGCE